MKKFNPGASIHGDYSYICDNCEIDDGRDTLRWEPLPGRKGHFCLCYDCLKKLVNEYTCSTNMEPVLQVTRIIIPEQLRNEIFERDNYKCTKCQSDKELQLDHIIPFSKGGKTEKSNLQTLCKTCNLKKGNSEEPYGLD
jgi:hypothetical protein